MTRDAAKLVDPFAESRAVALAASIARLAMFWRCGGYVWGMR